MKTMRQYLTPVIEFLTLPQRFRKLQKEHDLRMALNCRLQRLCEIQKSEIQKLSGSKTRRALRKAEVAAVKEEETKAVRHLKYMRVETQRRSLAALLPLQTVIRVQHEVEAMTDVELMNYRIPKREVGEAS